MGKERVSEGLAAGHARHWLEIYGDVDVSTRNGKKNVLACTMYDIWLLYHKAKMEKYAISR
jgi:hypothetical protein